MSNIRNYKKEELENIFNDSNSFSDFMSKIGYSKSGSAYKYVKKYLITLDINPEKLIGKRWSSNEKAIDEVFVENSSLDTKSIKKKILKYNLIDYRCKFCDNNGIWMNNVISLHLDHINGDNNDNRLCNLRFLCPNCHSQTDTYSGKKNKK